MKTASVILSIFLVLFTKVHSQSVTAGFITPDTVCVNTPVTITNTSIGASNYYWNFCTANVNTPPAGQNLGNIGGRFTGPVYIDYVYENGNYYGFVTNNWPNYSLVRLDFGNSLLNMPTATDLGTVGGIIPPQTEGVQVISNGGKWYVIVVGGDPISAASRIVKIELGANITNNAPTGINWGNIGNLAYPHDLYVFDDNGHWYGLTVNFSNNTVTRFDFTTSFTNTPTGTNLGNVGSLFSSTGIYAMKENGNWYAFVTNADNSNTLSRLDFGSSLLNAPTGINLGNIGGQFAKPWDIHIMKYCGNNIGFLINASTSELLKLDFGASITNTPTVMSYGNIGGMNFPHCISKIFREGADLYSFVPNAGSGSLTRIKFSGCSNANVPNSTSQNPAPVTYNSPGVYNINLSVDEGLPTQAAYCRQVVVMSLPHSLTKNFALCSGSLKIGSSIKAGSYLWNTGSTADSIIVNSPGIYWVESSRYGCSVRDSFSVTCANPQSVTAGFITPDTVCVNTPVNITNTSIGASSYYWNFCVADVNTPPVALNLGNPGNVLSQPVFMDIAQDNGNYYGFVTNHFPGGVTRLDFGNSLLNMPTAVFLGNISGALNPGAGTECIQIVKNNGKWYGIIVGGSVSNTGPRVITIFFGANLNNPAPAATNWGNLGTMAQPIDLHVFEENGVWYGLTVNAETNTLTRFNFTNNLDNPPTAVNLGNIGGLNYPTGVYALNDNGFWRVFIGNGGNSTLSRLDFGSTLLNTPTGVNLGNPNGSINTPRDITILRYCGQTVGFVTNQANFITRLNFPSITGVPTATNLGNLGTLNFPHSLSKLFRAGNDIYSFITNVNNNTITRLQFTGCTSSSVPSSTAQNPPAIVYNAPGVYNINLTVDDGLPTQNAFCKQVVVMALTHSPTKNVSVCPGANVKIGSAIKNATYVWNTGATTDSININSTGIYWVESNRFGCMVRDSFNVTANPSIVEFLSQQNLCTPKTVQFAANLTGISSYQWDFGNGQTNSSTLIPNINFASFGTFSVKLKVQFSTGCVDSLVKNITIDDIFDNSLVFNNDTTICLGDSVLLRTNQQAQNYCWQTASIAPPQSLNGYVKPATTTVYTLTSQLAGNNLAVNGDFSSGNTGFTSDYTYRFPNTAEAQYWVGALPSSWNSSVSNCVDHTTGTGQMLTVNGGPTANSKIWSQTISVTPNTNYNFSIWIQSLSASNPASLRFAINNIPVGNGISAGNSVCVWKQFVAPWNSGNNSTATITIVNNNTTASGNDFALDDIFFGQVTTVTDSVRINVTGLCDSISLTGPDKICSTSDTVSYSIYKSPNCTQQYSLLIDNSFATILSQTATSLKLVFKKTGTTTIKVAFANSCKTVVDSLNVGVNFSPTSITLGPDITSCGDTSLTLHAGPGFWSYAWQNGTRDSVLTASIPGVYTVVAQNLCGAQFTDSFRLIKLTALPFAALPFIRVVCKQDSVQFTASGGSNYSWQPASNFANANAASSKAWVNANAVFTVAITDAICNRDTLISIPVTSTSGANITIAKSNDVNCTDDAAVLVANGGVSYTWSPNLYISRSGNGSITVKPPQTQTYTVTGKDGNGCVGVDSVTVVFTKTGDQQLYMPSAFTPNGDGLNDVFRPTFTGSAAKYDFRVYNRWGQLIFRSKTPGEGWDGTFRSTTQPGDVYVYYVTAEGGCNGKFEKKGTFVLIR